MWYVTQKTTTPTICTLENGQVERVNSFLEGINNKKIFSNAIHLAVDALFIFERRFD
ncbi:hypothetical protein KSI01_09760 [Kurthia sibirica]|nr:hypothetical protein KSI01_09760 [Kurthia sibirica]